MELDGCTPSRSGCDAVCVRRAYKKYGDVKVLENLHMTVHQGTIYGLLGASGCGKTTLLSCVVGRRQLDSGDIRVMGFKPGEKGSGVPGKRIGYMPQEIALYFNFTIRQTMRYFGCIFEMESAMVEKATDTLLNMLDIPFPDRMVKNLSGGQMRRVSFAAALLHDPDILVLDEPTVGMDPVLRHTIWQHLLQITRSGKKTIILTTHYIEEARQAHRIGLMRNGRLLDEDCAEVLMRKYHSDSLEDVFLQLSARQEQAAGSPEILADQNVAAEDIEESTASTSSSDFQNTEECPQKHCFGLVAKGPMKALLFKNLVSVVRDPWYLGFIFGLCVLAVSCVYMGIGYSPHKLRVAVVNHDKGSPHPRCERALPPLDCNFEDLSCQYLSRLKKPPIIQEFYDSYESATEAVREGRVWGSLYFSENFTDQTVDRLFVTQWLTHKNVDNSSNIQVRMDMSDQVASLMVQRELRQAYLDFVQSLMVSCNYSSKLATVPLSMKQPVYGSETPTFLDFAAPGTLALMMFFFGVALSVWSITYERQDGLLNRNIVAGITSFEIMLSYFVTHFVVLCLQAALLVCFGIFVYNFQCEGSLALTIFLLLVQGVCGMFYGFLVSAICEEEITTAIVSVGSLLPMMFLCGISWPVEGMPTLLRIFSQFVPLTLPVKGLRAVMARGWTMWHFEVYVGFLSSSAWIFVLLALCVIALSVKKL